LGIDRSAKIARIQLQGEAYRLYTLSSCDLPSTNWNFLATFNLGDTPQTWFDSASAVVPRRYYRAVKLPAFTVPESADDFRLIDHQGNSHQLYWYQNANNVTAFVLIFTGNGCTKVQQMVPTINALTNFAPQGIITWLIDANSADNRSNIITQANALGIALPILHDRAQLVARAYHASGTPEAVCVDQSSWTIFYRGAIDDRLGSNAVSTTQYYLTNALANFLASRTVTPRQTQTNGFPITLLPISTPSPTLHRRE